MNTEATLKRKFWKHLKADRTAMLGLVGIEDDRSQPMTAQILHDEEGTGPIYFFSAKDVMLVREMGEGHRAVIHFSAKDHELFASVHGELVPDNDRSTIDALWNPFVAAWYEGGKDDPKLQLLRFEPEHAQVWLNEASLLAGLKIVLGRDPKRDYKDKVADVRLNG